MNYILEEAVKRKNQGYSSFTKQAALITIILVSGRGQMMTRGVAEEASAETSETL